MKLILCLECKDIFRLFEKTWRFCKCGKCGGIYTDDLNAEYWGKTAIPIGFDNSSLTMAIKRQPTNGLGYRFDAFVIPKECPTMVIRKTKPSGRKA